MSTPVRITFECGCEIDMSDQVSEEDLRPCSEHSPSELVGMARDWIAERRAEL